MLGGHGRGACTPFRSSSGAKAGSEEPCAADRTLDRGGNERARAFTNSMRPIEGGHIGNVGLLQNRMRIQATPSEKFSLPVLLAVILLTGVVRAQTPISETQDPLGRNTPQESVFQFLEACHARDYSKALRYLDLRRMPQTERAQDGPELARELEDLLDDTPFDIATLSRDPEGDQSDDLSDTLDRLATLVAKRRSG